MAKSTDIYIGPIINVGTPIGLPPLTGKPEQQHLQIIRSDVTDQYSNEYYQVLIIAICYSFTYPQRDGRLS